MKTHIQVLAQGNQGLDWYLWLAGSASSRAVVLSCWHLGQMWPVKPVWMASHWHVTQGMLLLLNLVTGEMRVWTPVLTCWLAQNFHAAPETKSWTQLLFASLPPPYCIQQLGKKWDKHQQWHSASGLWSCMKAPALAHCHANAAMAGVIAFM